MRDPVTQPVQTMDRIVCLAAHPVTQQMRESKTQGRYPEGALIPSRRQDPVTEPTSSSQLRESGQIAATGCSRQNVYTGQTPQSTRSIEPVD